MNTSITVVSTDTQHTIALRQQHHMIGNTLNILYVVQQPSKGIDIVQLVSVALATPMFWVHIPQGSHTHNTVCTHCTSHWIKSFFKVTYVIMSYTFYRGKVFTYFYTKFLQYRPNPIWDDVILLFL